MRPTFGIATCELLAEALRSTIHGFRLRVRAPVRAEAWKRRLLSGTVTRLEELAREEGVTASYVTRVMRVAFLAPDLKRAILDGVQPAGLTLQRVQDQEMPLAWERQRAQYCC